MLNKLKARKSQLQAKGGFTLVELIVVLVILAILAALLIPALTGYIDKANEKKIVSQTRQVVMAAQTLVSSAYGEGKVYDDETTLSNGSGAGATGKTTPTVTEVADLAEVKEKLITTIKVKGANVTSATVTDGKKTCTYTWNETDKTGSYKTETK